MNNLSWWEQESFTQYYDYIIIGAGIVGLSAGYQLKLKYPQAKIAILERGWLPSGASTKNAGFACFGSPTELDSDLKKTPTSDVVNLVRKRWDGLQLLLSILGADAIEFQNTGGYEVFLKGEESRFDYACSRLEYLNTLLKGIVPYPNTYEAIPGSDTQFGMKDICGMIRINGEGHLNTGKMMRLLWDKVLLNGIHIFTGVPVIGFKEEKDWVWIDTDDGARFSSRNLVITTNGFARQLMPFLDVFPARAQVFITNPLPGLKLQGTFHYDSGFYYFRNVGERILLGGGRNLDFAGESTWDFGNTPFIIDRLQRLLKDTIIPGQAFEIERVWSGIMGVGPVKQYIVEHTTERTSVAVRMGGMGVALGSQVGVELANIL